MYKIYVNDRPVFLVESSEIPSFSGTEDLNTYVALYMGKKRQILQYLDLLEKSTEVERVILHHSDVELLWHDFKDCYEYLEAAGGLVYNVSNELLVFYRRGFWDLPKGKIDPGETPEQAAVREVQEETGVQHIDLGPLLFETWHAYRQKKVRYIKRTYWYHMDTPDMELTPQTEEGIEEIKWVDKEAWLATKPHVYRSLLEVLEGV
jgi:ADP-ribose pyrophosphatase YjhB (NUDIX family)